MNRVRANFYSQNKQIGLNVLPNTTGYLFSNARYPTKLTAEDIPPWYMRSNFYAHIPGFLNARGVTFLSYRPCHLTKYMFRDDFLCIRYTSSAREKRICFFGDILCDEYIWGYNIPRFLIYAEHYSHYDTAEIWNQIEEKRRWFRETYPDEYYAELGRDQQDQALHQWAILVYSNELE